MTRTLLTGGRIFDGVGTQAAEGDVLIEGARILDVGTDLDADEIVDVSGLTLIPGLFDTHVHVTAPGVDLIRRLHRPFSMQFYEAMHNLAATLDCGITSVRDAAGADLGVKRAVETGMIDGPRMQIAISMLSQTGGHADHWVPSGISISTRVPHPGRPDGIVDGPDAMRKTVREVVRAGADVIKVCTSGGVMSPGDHPDHTGFDDEELAALMSTAAALGVPVMSHAQATAGIKNAVRAGVRSIEHGIYLDDEAIEMMLRAGAWLVPTLSAPVAVAEAARTGAKLPEGVLEKAQDVARAHQDSFARAVDAGVKIAMGTDSGVGPHGENLRELELMAAGGMAPADVLSAAGRSAAQLLRVDDELGSLEPGKRADIVLIGGDVFSFADLKSRIRAVYKDGALVRGWVGSDSDRPDERRVRSSMASRNISTPS